MYKGRLFVHEIPNHGASCHDLGTIGKPSIIMVHQVDFIMFQPIMEKLLTIEQIFNENLFKSKLEIIGEFGYTFDILESP
jgi:hypothetical protein